MSIPRRDEVMGSSNKVSMLRDIVTDHIKSKSYSFYINDWNAGFENNPEFRSEHFDALEPEVREAGWDFRVSWNRACLWWEVRLV